MVRENYSGCCWDTDEMVHLEGSYPGNSSHGLSEGRALHSSPAQPSPVLHLHGLARGPGSIRGQLQKGVNFKTDQPTRQGEGTQEEKPAEGKGTS